MSGPQAHARADEILSAMLGPAGRDLFESDWAALSGRVVDYVYDRDRRDAVRDYGAVRRHLSENWNVPCVEVASTIQGMGPLKAKGRQLGRLSVRMLRILSPLQCYIALNGEIPNHEKRLALLHELGHLVLHAEVLQALGTVYHRVCINPALEFEIGRFTVRASGRRLAVLQEMEADLFALTWLLPLRADEGADAADVAAGAVEALTADGYKFHKLRGLFSDSEGRAVAPAKVPGLNRLGEEARRRGSGRDYPAGGSLVERFSWVLFNRPRLLRELIAERRTLMVEYFDLIGPPRYIPELSRRYSFSRKQSFNPEHAWIPRVGLEEVPGLIDSEHWEPLLASSHVEGLPDYYIPIAPVPSATAQDSEAKWHNLAKATCDLPLDLSEWLERAAGARAGLLMFPRNPAERLLDRQKAVR